MSLFQWIGLPWNLLLSLATMVLACVLVIDADWMWKLVRGKDLLAQPPLFGGIIAAKELRPKAKYVALFGLVLVPLLMVGAVPLPARDSGHNILWTVASLLVLVPPLLWAEVHGWKWISNSLALLVCGSLLLPYAMSGWVGVQRYLIIQALFWPIAAILYLAVLLHHRVLGRAPQTRAGQVIRLAVGVIGAIGIMAATFWPWRAPG